MAAAPGDAAAETVGDGLVVYYFHSNYRCPTCRSIESQAKETLDADFASQLNSGEIVWKIVNYEKPAGKKLADEVQGQRSRRRAGANEGRRNRRTGSGSTRFGRWSATSRPSASTCATKSSRCCPPTKPTTPAPDDRRRDPDARTPTSAAKDTPSIPIP